MMFRRYCGATNWILVRGNKFAHETLRLDDCAMCHMNACMNLIQLFASVLIGISAVSAADWPQWRGPQRTGHAASDTKLVRLPSEPKTIWRIKAGEGLASPVVASGKAFLFDNQGGKETVRAVDAATGKELWSTPIDDV